MNIGIVTTWFERGASYVSKSYFETLSLKHNVYIYARGGEKYAIGDPKWDFEYVTWGKKVPNSIPTYIDWEDFKEWVERNSIRIIIFNEQHSWEIILKSRELGVIIGAYIDYYTKETINFFKIYDFLLCNTKRHHEVFKNHPNVIYIPWGTSINEFPFRIEKINKNGIIFFHSSGMNPYRKGTDLVIKAFKQINNKSQLIIHSQIQLDRNSHLYKSIIEDSRIFLIEKEIGPPGLYHLGDIYVYPTRLEGIGLTIPESLASGLPVITTNDAPMNEFIINMVNGLLVDVEKKVMRSDKYYWPMAICNLDNLRSCMEFFILNENQITKFKQNSRNYAEKNLNWEKNSSDINKILSNIKRIEMINESLIKQISFYERKQTIKWKIHKEIIHISHKYMPIKILQFLKERYRP